MAKRKTAKKRKPRAVKIARGEKVAWGKEKKAHEKPGGSSVGKYKNVAKGDFCGPSGGAPAGSYPVNSKKRAIAALAYAHNAPNPEGIRKCVHRKFPSVGKTTRKKKK